VRAIEHWHGSERTPSLPLSPPAEIRRGGVSVPGGCALSVTVIVTVNGLGRRAAAVSVQRNQALRYWGIRYSTTDCGYGNGAFDEGRVDEEAPQRPPALDDDMIQAIYDGRRERALEDEEEHEDDDGYELSDNDIVDE
jgi:hypothetical protein